MRTVVLVLHFVKIARKYSCSNDLKVVVSTVYFASRRKNFFDLSRKIVLPLVRVGVSVFI